MWRDRKNKNKKGGGGGGSTGGQEEMCKKQQHNKCEGALCDENHRRYNSSREHSRNVAQHKEGAYARQRVNQGNNGHTSVRPPIQPPKIGSCRWFGFENRRQQQASVFSSITETNRLRTKYHQHQHQQQQQQAWLLLSWGE